MKLTLNEMSKCEYCHEMAEMLTRWDEFMVCNDCLVTDKIMKPLGLIHRERIARGEKKLIYHDYLVSERWKTLAEACKALAENRCKVCGKEENLNAHHRSYKRLNKPEEILDLVCLCRGCHSKFHDKEAA